MKVKVIKLLDRGGLRSEKASLIKLKELMAIQVAGQEKPKAPAQKNENGDENQQAKKMYLKERLSKIGDFDSSKEKPCLFA